MPPQLIIAALMAGSQLTQALWNGRANELAAQQQRMQLRKQQGFADTQYFSQLGTAFQQQQEAAKAASNANSAAEARAADGSIAGPTAQDYATAAEGASSQAFSNWSDQTFNGIDLSRQIQTDAYTQQMDELGVQQTAAATQFGLQAATSPLTFLSSAYNSNTGKMAWDKGDPGWGKPFNSFTGVGLNPETGTNVTAQQMEFGSQPGVSPANMTTMGKSLDYAKGLQDVTPAISPALPPEADGIQVPKPAKPDIQAMKSDYEQFKDLGVSLDQYNQNQVPGGGIPGMARQMLKMGILGMKGQPRFDPTLLWSNRTR